MRRAYSSRSPLSWLSVQIPILKICAAIEHVYVCDHGYGCRRALHFLTPLPCAVLGVPFSFSLLLSVCIWQFALIVPEADGCSAKRCSSRASGAKSTLHVYDTTSFAYKDDVPRCHQLWRRRRRRSKPSFARLQPTTTFWTTVDTGQVCGSFFWLVFQVLTSANLSISMRFVQPRLHRCDT